MRAVLASPSSLRRDCLQTPRYRPGGFHGGARGGLRSDGPRRRPLVEKAPSERASACYVETRRLVPVRDRGNSAVARARRTWSVTSRDRGAVTIRSDPGPRAQHSVPRCRVTRCAESRTAVQRPRKLSLQSSPVVCSHEKLRLRAGERRELLALQCVNLDPTRRVVP